MSIMGVVLSSIYSTFEFFQTLCLTRSVSPRTIPHDTIQVGEAREEDTSLFPPEGHG